MNFSMVKVEAMTSWIKVAPITSESPMPPEPVIEKVKRTSPSAVIISLSTLIVAVLTSEKCRS